MPIKINDLTLFDLKEISQKFGLSIDSIRSYIQAGKLKGRKFGVKWYVSARALEEYFSGKLDDYLSRKRESEEPIKKESQIVKDPLIEELREVMEEKNVSANAAAGHIKTHASQVIKWLKYRAKPIPGLRKRIKQGIARMKRL